ncbi:MAG: chemotaxis response regulator protein-glutamate methylesterase [Lachnospiraceae bacterium]|nr:chemotaxis response regulator protein-glutamate methylesterase [Lachnospiraceae bacterium]MBR5788478.1 chemotaxis response regulator protein-glutamate methylesterase [Lachnospiraceae bacterium]
MKKNIMVVDDSALMRRALCDIINADDSFKVVDEARDGLEAYEKIKANKYDAIILDINMPRMDGLELLRKLHTEKIDVVVIVASTLTKAGSKETFEALSLGAVDFVTKPENIIEARGQGFTSDLTEVLKAVLRVEPPKPEVRVEPTPVAKPKAPISEIKVPVTPKPILTAEKVKKDIEAGVPKVSTVKPGNKLIALACSTGGPKSLQEVIPLLPKGMNAPMVLVQHMPQGFTKSMAERLDEISEVSVKEAEEGDVLKVGCIYVAPGGKHMQIIKKPTGDHVVHLDDSPPIGGLKPCADIMYESLIDSSYEEIVCVVLTGMGADGTKGITALHESKKIFTISQDEVTSVVYGMPRAIRNAGLSNVVVPLQEVASTIIMNVGVR